ncbi:metallophosphoesterase [uncultured Corynebacterium sp.]|uniref:metallophosphoesterase family protein n=1 Tax=uncultured Corynebacterium sp. TaxID=159447 RepID=UPI0025986766|nr:metallophosphoesterase [uncultured Corynebacterium sp.]
MSRHSHRLIPATVIAAAAFTSAIAAPVTNAAEAPNYTYLDINEHPRAPQPGFRVLPYLQKPAADKMTLNFFGELGTDATVVLKEAGKEVKSETTKGELQEHLRYTVAELNQEIKGLEKGSWLKSNNNYKYSVTFTELKPATTYEYTVTLDGVSKTNSFTTAPTADAWNNIRIVAFSDTETEPAGRPKIDGAREWERNRSFAEGSLDRPGEGSAWFEKFGSNTRLGVPEPRYPLTQDDAMKYNIGEISKQKPDLLLVAGDLGQGGGYQPGWDEYFGYVAGEHGDLAGSTPMLTALGNWETFGAANGSYQDADGIAWGAAKGRNAYMTYFDTFGSDTPEHEDSYYRIDHGPVTVITLDSTKGLPDENAKEEKEKAIPGNDKEFFAEKGDWGKDTNTSFTMEGMHAAGGTSQPDFSEGSEQWKWAEKQLADAREKGQYIIVQFHHTPYSSGVHGTATASATPDAQPGTPMRVYTPLFEKYGVTAVISGHDEMFERSFIDDDGDGIGFHNFDVGVAADGLRGDYRVKNEDGTYSPIDFNTYREWMAQSDEPEMWIDDENGVRQLKDGGKHYGHLQMDLEPLKCSNNVAAKLTTTPVYLFPVLDSNYDLVRVERRVYNDVQEILLDKDGRPTKRDVKCDPASGSSQQDSSSSSALAGVGIAVGVLAALLGALGFVALNADALPLPPAVKAAIEQARSAFNI